MRFPVTVRLSADWLSRADAEALRRDTVNQATGVKDRGAAVHQSPEKRAYNGRQGTRAEVAVHLATGLAWIGEGQHAKGKPDLEGGHQVKWSGDGRLRIQGWNEPGIYFATTGGGDEITILGWSPFDAWEDEDHRTTDEPYFQCYRFEAEELETEWIA